MAALPKRPASYYLKAGFPHACSGIDAAVQNVGVVEVVVRPRGAETAEKVVVGRVVPARQFDNNSEAGSRVG